MVRRATKSFQHQTYKNSWLLIYDTTPNRNLDLGIEPGMRIYQQSAIDAGATMGTLRNSANESAFQVSSPNCPTPDIFVHWDSDDWSDPRRIEEQVDFLNNHEHKECVGYNQMVFWDTRGPEPCVWIFKHPSRLYVMGTSMCYWASFWHERPFPDSKHEDHEWWMRNAAQCRGELSIQFGSVAPRMIASIHGSNTSEAYRDEIMIAPYWTKHPEFEAYCADRMAL